MGERMFAKSPVSGHPFVNAHAFLLDGGRVLLVRRSSEAAYAPNTRHASVAGKVEPGEDEGSLGSAVRPGLRRLRYRPDLVDGFLAHTGFQLGTK
ncbi:NUDIX hydrolase [Thermobifida halotolerans]|uniref:NUDIX hydrolase n=1 Tax=Thermobifida halotolerans TaxID=483545 RepID=A0A399FWY3_9ACTN|nr:NUDIX hydrolase [Thermobifida halotolerans]UOE21471.1 NUDIX hydrolase [Thermobifida halotolerans]